VREQYDNTSGDCFISSELVELQIIASQEVIRRREICSYLFRIEADCETFHLTRQVFLSGGNWLSCIQDIRAGAGTNFFGLSVVLMPTQSPTSNSF